MWKHPTDMVLWITRLLWLNYTYLQSAAAEAASKPPTSTNWFRRLGTTSRPFEIFLQRKLQHRISSTHRITLKKQSTSCVIHLYHHYSKHLSRMLCFNCFFKIPSLLFYFAESVCQSTETLTPRREILNLTYPGKVISNSEAFVT